MKLNGIPNCDTVKKARAWLDARGIAYDWVDFRKTPPSAEDVARWSRAVGWETLLNRRGTTWRSLDAASRDRVVDAPAAVRLMAEHPTLIRRPVIERGSEVVVGFSDEAYSARFRALPRR
jgi:Spx/MgsR family transcriptional regulator